MNKFEKISKKQYEEVTSALTAIKYENIELPRRATKFSAGYDFFSPIDFNISPGETVKIPTGIRVKLDDNKFLMIAPRSSLGFKYRLQLDNTIAIIDSDYYNAANEGHIWLKLTNDSKSDTVLTVKKGDALVQGIILEYFKVEDDNSDQTRQGGIGSTSK